MACGACGEQPPKATRAGCGATWDASECFWCQRPADWLGGWCEWCEKRWNPAVCPKTQCQGNVRRKDWRDFGLEPQPPDPPAWVLYLIGCGHSLGRQAGGMGSPGPILETEAQAMVAQFPAHQEALIRRVLGTLERVGDECDREARLKAEDEASAGKGGSSSAATK